MTGALDAQDRVRQGFETEVTTVVRSLPGAKNFQSG